MKISMQCKKNMTLLSVFIFIIVLMMIIIWPSYSSEEINSLESSNKQIVKRWLEQGWNQKKSDIFYGLLSDDFVNHCTGRNLKRMKKDLKEYFEQNKPTSPVTIKDILAEGNKVSIRMIHQAPGREPRLELVFCLLKGGKITDVWNCFCRKKR